MSEQALSEKPEDNLPAEDDNKDFEAAFAERMGSEVPKSDDAEDGSSDDGKEEGAASAPSDDQAGKPPEGGEPAKPEGEKKFDPYEGLTPAQAEHFRRLEQSERSQRGRVGALTTKLNTIAAVPKQPQDDQQQDQGGKTANDLEERLSRAAEDYPDAVGPLKEMVEQLGKKLGDLSSKVEPIAERESEEALRSAYDALASKHPDYAEIARDQGFHEWAGSQTPGIQTLVRSLDPEEVSLALTLYKTEAGIEQTPAASGGKTETDARRGRQLDATRDVVSRGAPVASGTPNDFEAAFQARMKQFSKS